LEWVIAIIPSLIVGIFLYFFSREQNKRDVAADSRVKARKKESLLSLELQMATAKLSYATAMALKRGYANGEVEEGIESYEEAKKKYFDFLNEQAVDHVCI